MVKGHFKVVYWVSESQVEVSLILIEATLPFQNNVNEII